MAGLGLRGVNMTSDPQDLGAPDLANRAWDPLWEVCADLQLPVHFHIGASLTTMTYFGTYPWESQDEDTKLAIGGTLLFIGNARVVTNIILSGMLDRHPTLQDGLGRERRGLDPLHPRGARLRDVGERARSSWTGSRCSRRSTSAGTCTPRSGSRRTTCPRSSTSVGEDNVLFETDFPHPTCLYPKPLDTVADKMSTLTPEVQRKILGENAAEAVPALSTAAPALPRWLRSGSVGGTARSLPVERSPRGGLVSRGHGGGPRRPTRALRAAQGIGGRRGGEPVQTAASLGTVGTRS